jgi:hypothetical protein
LASTALSRAIERIPFCEYDQRMFMRFEILTGTVTLTGSVSGERGNWTVRVTSPGGDTAKDETTERTWFPLWTELVTTASENAKRRRSSGARSEVVR